MTHVLFAPHPYYVILRSDGTRGKRAICLCNEVEATKNLRHLTP